MATQATNGLSHLMEAATALSSMAALPILPRSTVSTSTSSLSSTSSTSAGASIQQPEQAQHQHQQQLSPSFRSVVSDDDEDRLRLLSSAKSRKREIFPQRLMDILSDPSLTDIITWLPHGQSFVVIRPDLFTERVLPKYLPPVDARGGTKYPSFTRKLNRWGFRQATRGSDTGAFYHPLFRRDDKELCLRMVCQKSCRERKEVNEMNNASTDRPHALPPKKRTIINDGNSSDGTSSDVQTNTDIDMEKFIAPSQGPAESGIVSSNSSHATAPLAGSPSMESFANASQLDDADTVEKAAKVDPSPKAPSPFVEKADIDMSLCHSKPTHVISNDPVFVENVLRQRDEEERLRAARQMLREAFESAFKSASHKSS